MDKNLIGIIVLLAASNVTFLAGFIAMARTAARSESMLRERSAEVCRLRLNRIFSHSQEST
jgi:hypothetical protein